MARRQAAPARRESGSVACAGGAETSEDAANCLAEHIRQDSVEKSPGFVVRIDSTT